MKYPDEFELFAADDTPFRVRYDYDKGEQQWFDARAGVGSPGYDAYVCITEVNFGDGWKSPDEFQDIDWSAYEAAVMQRLIDIDEAVQAARDEREYNDFLEWGKQ